MKKQHLFVCVAALLLLVTVQANAKDTATVNKMIQEAKGLMSSDPARSIELSSQARSAAAAIGYWKGEATALKNIGIIYYNQQKYLETLEYWNLSLEIFQKNGDDVGASNLFNNIAAVYKDGGVDEKALEYALQGLKLAEKTGDKGRLTASLVTIAAIYHNQKNRKAIDYLMQAKAIADKDSYGVLFGNLAEGYFDIAESLESNPDSTAVVQEYYRNAMSNYIESLNADSASGNAAFSFNGIGKVHFKMGRYQEAIRNHQKALGLSEQVDDKWNRFKAYQGMANAYIRLKDIPRALQYYNTALRFAEEVENTDLADLYRDMSDAYESTGDLRNALAFQKKFSAKRMEIFNADVDRQLGRMDLTHQLERKEDQVNLLTKEKELEQQAKTAFAIGLGLILIIAIILFRNYKAKVRINKLLDKQKAEIETLLLNILPAEVAHELQTKGQATPRHYDNVSVLFTDFKGFTSLADKMSPQDLVSQLSECFVAFDNIVEKHGLEKIKTIGDAYMCAGGIPLVDERHAYKIVRAALEIQQWVADNNRRRETEGLEPWDIRIGIHSGPLVAGVVGKKKYAYDIWGSTVNIAARMESNSEPGRVNISAAVHELVKDDFNCSYRGKIYAKNVGDIDMYFVDSEITRSYRLAGTTDESSLIASAN